MESISDNIAKQISLNYEAKRKFNVHRPMKNRSALNISLDRIAEVKEFRSNWNVEKDPIEIIIIGAGGTGGYLVRDLSRFLYSLDKRLQVPTMDIQVTIVDGDMVEEKNILRQNFLPQDIGLNKAEVLAKRHSKAFGLNISYISEMYGSYSFSIAKKNRIIVGCVDNNAARREIAYFVSRCWDSYQIAEKNAYWIDSGNEKKTGQVIVGSRELQDVTDIYPEIYLPEHDSVEQISCAERMLQDEQNMFVNLTASNLILNYVKNIILDIPMVTHGTVFNIDNKFDNYYILKKTNNE